MKSICNNARLFRSHDSEKCLPTDPMLPCPSPHRQVAAALSAAVTTTKFIGNRPHLAWAHKSEGSVKPIPSYSSGEGVWGRGASLREAASPPEFPLLVSSGGSAREGASLQRSPLPRKTHYSHFPTQKFEKTSSRMRSSTSSPVISPRAAIA